MTQPKPRPEEEATRHATDLIAQGLSELQRAVAAPARDARDELSASRGALEELAQRIERQLSEEKDQRLVLATQLTSLATSLDRLVTHLQGLSQLMADILERLVEPVAAPVRTEMIAEPVFQPGGEGVSLILAAVPGFQALMDIQKALVATDQVESASVERFQEGESRLLLHLRSAVSGSDLAADLRQATGFAIVVEESRPEVARLRLKIVPAS